MFLRENLWLSCVWFFCFRDRHQWIWGVFRDNVWLTEIFSNTGNCESKVTFYWIALSSPWLIYCKSCQRYGKTVYWLTLNSPSLASHFFWGKPHLDVVVGYVCWWWWSFRYQNNALMPFCCLPFGRLTMYMLNCIYK